MHFKNPEVLYLLFLLVIPIIVHLFQLRKFKKEYFTNVAFLKELSIQTRKSSKIKKWLLLATRLLLLTFIIIAFAQPFFEVADNFNKNNELYVIVDNSYSMQAKGEKGELLKRTLQELQEKIPRDKTFSLLTNNQEYWDTTISAIQNEIQNITYSAIPFSLENSLIKINNRNPLRNKDLLFITDGIGTNSPKMDTIDKKNNTYFIIPKAQKLENISIDSIYLSQTLDNFYEIAVLFSSTFKKENNIPISVYNGKKILAKTILKNTKKQEKLLFTIPKTDFQGKITITDNSLDFDNTYYFTISKPKSLKVLGIGEPEKNIFLQKIYTQPDFEYNATTISNIDYSKLLTNDAIILNELDQISPSLQTNLKSFVLKGGQLVVIPSKNISNENQNKFLNLFGGIQLQNIELKELKITKINFGNPLFTDVFQKKINNFQYPMVKETFIIKSDYPKALSYINDQSFLTTIRKKTGNLYIFAAPINTENSNFQNSPLIVPVFYKMVQNGSKNEIISEIIQNDSPFILKSFFKNNHLISIKNNVEEFIPIQEITTNTIKINCFNNPINAGNFQIIQDKEQVGFVSFNYNRDESNLENISTNFLENINQLDSIESFFDKIILARNDSEIWKWFVGFSLLFLIIEILIQKFVK